MELFPEWSSLLPRHQLYPSLQHEADVVDADARSCLHQFPEEIARDITRRLCISMAPGSQSRLQDTYHLPAYLSSYEAIAWSMQVLHYALTRPIDEHETIKAAMNVYSEWLSVALPHPRPFVPECVREQPNVYIRRFLRHLFKIFLPRLPSTSDIITKQGFLCHRALKLVEDILSESPAGLLDNDTWEQALILMLSINDMLLSPPAMPSDFADACGERCLGALFRCWETACTRHFPSYVQWKTFHEVAKTWRHRLPLVETWIRALVHFHRCLLPRLKSSSFCEKQGVPIHSALTFANAGSRPDSGTRGLNGAAINNTDLAICQNLSNDTLLLSWALFTFLLGNPNDLCRPHVVAKTERLLSAVMSNTNDRNDEVSGDFSESFPASSILYRSPGRIPTLVDSEQLDCLAILPLCYLKAFAGLSAIIDMYLGMLADSTNGQIFPFEALNTTSAFGTTGSTTPVDSAIESYLDVAWPGLRQTQAATGGKSSLVHASADSLAMKPKLRPLRSARKLNIRGLLSFYGPWLFEAALVNLPFRTVLPTVPLAEIPSLQAADAPATASTVMKKRLMMTLYQQRLWAPGRAEASACLCRMLCMHQVNETLPPLLVARGIAALASGLDIFPIKLPSSPQYQAADASVLSDDADSSLSSSLSCLPDYMTATNIVGNSADLLRSHIEGVECLWPAVIDMASHALMQQIEKLHIHPELQEGSRMREACLYNMSAILCAAHLFSACGIHIEDARRALWDHYIATVWPKQQLRHADSNNTGFINATRAGFDDTLTSNFTLPVSQSSDDVVDDAVNECTEFDDATTPTAAGNEVATSKMPFPPASHLPSVKPTTLSRTGFSASDDRRMSVASGDLFQQIVVLLMSCMDGEQNRQNQQLLLSLANTIINIQFLTANNMETAGNIYNCVDPYMSFRMLLCLNHQIVRETCLYDLIFARGALEVLLSAARLAATATSLPLGVAFDWNFVGLTPADAQFALVRSNVRAVCRFIRAQTRRPPTAHSKDLHNRIIVAYQCLLMWVMVDPSSIMCSSSDLIMSDENDEDILALVTEVLELGTHGPQLKSNKLAVVTNNANSAPSPISIRVRDIAEQVRTQLLECLPAARCFTTPLEGAEKSHEQALLEFMQPLDSDKSHAFAGKIHYAFVDDNTILSLIDLKAKNDTSENEWWCRTPTFVVVRNAAGLNTWLFRQHRRRSRRRKENQNAGVEEDAKPTGPRNKKRLNFFAAAEKNLLADDKVTDDEIVSAHDVSLKFGEENVENVILPMPSSLPKQIVHQEFRKIVDQLPGAVQIPECEADRIFSTIDELTFNRMQKQPQKQKPENSETDEKNDADNNKNDFQTLFEYVSAGFADPDGQKPAICTVRNVWSDLPDRRVSIGAQLERGFKRVPITSNTSSKYSSQMHANTTRVPSVAVSQLVSGLGLHDASPQINRQTNNSGSPAHSHHANGAGRRAQHATATTSNGGNSRASVRVSNNNNNSRPSSSIAGKQQQLQPASSPVKLASRLQIESQTQNNSAHRVVAAPALKRRLSDELAVLDKVAIRPLDWIIVTYVGSPAVDTNWRNILANAVPLDTAATGENINNNHNVVINPEYFLFLQSLGYIVDVDTVLNIDDQQSPNGRKSRSLTVKYLDGIEHMLYYADHLAQLGIIVPSLRSCSNACDSMETTNTVIMSGSKSLPVVDAASALRPPSAAVLQNGDEESEEENSPTDLAIAANNSNLRARSLSADDAIAAAVLPDAGPSVTRPTEINQKSSNILPDMMEEDDMQHVVQTNLSSTAVAPQLELPNNSTMTVNQNKSDGTSAFTMAERSNLNLPSIVSTSVASTTRATLHVAWLNASDPFSRYRLPVRELSEHCRFLPLPRLLDSNQYVVIYISPHTSANLYELSVRNALGERIDVLMPIHDGQIVSHRVLAALIRQAALNFYANQRLNENTTANTGAGAVVMQHNTVTHATSYVKRKQIIHDLAHRFGGADQQQQHVGGNNNNVYNGVSGLMRTRTSLAARFSTSSPPSSNACRAVTDAFLFW